MAEAVGAGAVPWVASLVVSKAPGTTWFTRMPCCASSAASALVRPRAPILEAQTWAQPGRPLKALSPETFTIRPQPFSIIDGTTALLQK